MAISLGTPGWGVNRKLGTGTAGYQVLLGGLAGWFGRCRGEREVLVLYCPELHMEVSQLGS